MSTIRILTTWIVLLVITAAFGWAQTGNMPRTSVIIIDKQRVLSETLYGRRLASELRQMEQLQIADNKRLLQELELEEASLTKQRSSMNADEFRVLAANFDEKVQLISDQQQAKNQRRMEQRRKDQMILMSATGPVFETLMRDTGADVIIEQRYAFVWNDAINLTDVAIERIDALLGDGKTRSEAGKE
jgi:Skp family chaperone for outer membrane proteins